MGTCVILPNAHRFAKKPAQEELCVAPGSCDPSSTAHATCAQKQQTERQLVKEREFEPGNTYAGRVAKGLRRNLHGRRRTWGRRRFVRWRGRGRRQLGRGVRWVRQPRRLRRWTRRGRWRTRQWPRRRPRWLGRVRRKRRIGNVLEYDPSGFGDAHGGARSGYGLEWVGVDPGDKIVDRRLLWSRKHAGHDIGHGEPSACRYIGERVRDWLHGRHDLCCERGAPLLGYRQGHGECPDLLDDSIELVSVPQSGV